MSTQYKYRAASDDGQIHRGVIASDSKDQVVEYLSQRDLKPIKIAPYRRFDALTSAWPYRKTDIEGLILFTRSLLTMHRAGIPLLRALSIMRAGPAGRRFNRAIEQMRLDVQSGRSLSQAMAKHGGLFPPVYVASITAGEESGRLEDILEELSDTLEQEKELSRAIRSGVRYPLIVITAVGAAITVLVTYVIPKFAAFYSAFGAQLPLPTRILIGTGTFFARHWLLLAAALIAISVGFRVLVSTESGKLWFDRQALKLPVFGDLIIKGNVARLMMMFRTLFRAGLPIIRCLEILRGSVKNSMVASEVEKLRQLLREGRESMLSSSRFSVLPELVLHMMAIGLESGSLESMAQEMGRHYAQEVRYTSRHLTSILEPVLTFVLGIFVLILALAVFLPMWNLISVLRGG